MFLSPGTAMNYDEIMGIEAECTLGNYAYVGEMEYVTISVEMGSITMVGNGKKG